MPPTNDQVRELNRELREIDALGGNDLPQVHARLVALKEKAAALGIRSAHLEARLAQVLLGLERLEEAFAAVSRSVVIDPVQPSISNLFVRVASACREALEQASRDAESDVTPRLYAVLSAAGETDARCHVALARHHLAAGRTGEARALLEAVTLLEPAHADAWDLLAEVARAEGNASAAEELSARAAGLREARTPFGIPSPFARC
jgi:tetratricopeptide (TPR) repeat protein